MIEKEKGERVRSDLKRKEGNVTGGDWVRRRSREEKGGGEVLEGKIK